jgi:hypothetical protein
VRQVPRVRVPDGGQRPVAVAPEGGHDVGLHARLDHHHLGALAEPPHHRSRLRPRRLEARGTDVTRLHRRGRVEHHDHLARPFADDGHHRAREGDAERHQREDLEDQQRVALQALEEGRGLAVAQLGAPQHEARHRSLAPAHLEEVEEDERQREAQGGERERRQEIHATTLPLS